MGCVGRACEWLGLLADTPEPQTEAGNTDAASTGSLSSDTDESSNITTKLASMQCVTGSGGCGLARFMTTDSDSEFHTAELRDVSRKIEALLAPIRDRGNEYGLDLAFVNTKQGYLLAWANHPDERPTGNTISIANSADEIAAALGLISFDGDSKAL